jgi:hypothetical protein
MTKPTLRPSKTSIRPLRTIKPAQLAKVAGGMAIINNIR